MERKYPGNAIDHSDILSLCDIIRQTGFEIHCYLKNGHLEKVYENALVHRLTKQGIKVVSQFPLKVHDIDGTVIGDYFADLFVDDRLIIELKACRTLTAEHEAQLLGYLAASRMQHGMLLNFGAPKFQIKKFIL